MLKYIKGEYNGDTSKIKNSDKNDEKSGDNTRYSIADRQQLKTNQEYQEMVYRRKHKEED